MNAEDRLLFRNYPESEEELSPLRLEESIRITLNVSEVVFELVADQAVTKLDKVYLEEVMAALQRSFEEDRPVKIDKDKFETIVKRRGFFFNRAITIAIVLYVALVPVSLIYVINDVVLPLVSLLIIGALIYRRFYAAKRLVIKITN